MKLPSPSGFVLEVPKPINAEKSSLHQGVGECSAIWKGNGAYFVMGPPVVMNVRGYFELVVGAYFAGPVMPVI